VALLGLRGLLQGGDPPFYPAFSPYNALAEGWNSDGEDLSRVSRRDPCRQRGRKPLAGVCLVLTRTITSPPTVMLAMDERTRTRVLTPPVRARLDDTAYVVPVGPGDSFLAAELGRIA
jgi:hypothetical protein